ncbi:hypothetical protein OP10G_2160 [Fimbriimonas ginsengisoli Gsoil 348]|uniref:Uncharacterized protein n=2 Tax=Fimbriimonas ginsengisoli TaxID=1005039 RepID=A0A068NPQ5_FIMGI|nr:hypothetical protein OP10G_2160 [Fimbriimonas ginsengisoli Gsoil 348]
MLLVAGGAVAIMNAPPAHTPNPDDTPKTGEDVKVEDKADLAKDVKKDLITTPKKGMMGGPRGPDGEEMEMPPAVLKRKPSTNKPMPSESSTSTQWYSKETPKEIPKAPTVSAPPTMNIQGTKPMDPPGKR